MEDDTATVLLRPSNPLLPRRNSILTAVVVPSNFRYRTKSHHQSSGFSSSSTIGAAASTTSSSSSADFDVISIKPVASYTSLKDLLPATAVNSPKAQTQCQSGSEISIRNRLVKQAAWAYLQPMSTSPGLAGRGLLQRLWVKFSGDGGFLRNNHPVISFFRHTLRVVIRAIDRLLRVIWVPSCR